MRRQSRLFRDADSLRLCRMPIESEHVVRLGDRSSSCSEFSRGYAETFFESFRKTALTRETELFRYIRKGMSVSSSIRHARSMRTDRAYSWGVMPSACLKRRVS